MSGIYDTFREQLIDWMLNGGAPADAVPYVMGVDDSYTFDTAHANLSDLGASDVIDAAELTGFTYTNGVLRADNLLIEGITPGPIVDAFVVFFSWTGGDHLVCYVDSATDASLPVEIVTGKLNILWAAGGICKI